MTRGPIVFAVVIILGWWGISLTRSLSTSEGSFKRPVADGEEGKSALRMDVPVAAPAATAPAPEQVKAVKPPPAFEFQNELNHFAQLKAKVLPSPEERAEREALLKDRRLLLSLGQRLAKVPLMALGEQDVAIDLLVEALQNGDKEAAQEAIGAIVADAQVENTQLSIPVREQLAGIKAEVLYHWTAYEPSQASRVGSLLPGPASRKIWGNVIEAQKNNLAESAQERDR